MGACEKCWGDAFSRSISNRTSQAEEYYKLLEERKDKPCTHEQQAGDSVQEPAKGGES